MMKRFFWVVALLCGFFILTSCANKSEDKGVINISSVEEKKSEVKQLSEHIVQFDQKCAQGDEASCQSLLDELGRSCRNDEALSCITLAQIGAVATLQFSHQKKSVEAFQWLDITLGALKKSCDLRDQRGCNALGDIKSNFKSQCDLGDKISCEISQAIE